MRRSTSEFLALAITFGACGSEAPPSGGPPAVEPVWSVAGQDGLATFSSPRVLDVDGDGVKDVLLGLGVPGEDATGAGADGAVVAIRGTDGSEIWRSETDADVFGSAALLEIDGDGTPDVVIGGRGAELRAVSGKSGALLWRWEVPEDPAAPGALQFFSAQVAGDLDDDGVGDLLVANGGFPAAKAGEPRPPGHLLLISGADGTAIAAAVMPDGAETYLSPLLHEVAGETRVVFGSGGESLPGSLWTAALADLVAGDLSEADELVSPAGTKGVIAPPALADLDGDGTEDLVVATFDARLVAVGGAGHDVLWEHATDGAETYATPALGLFDEDEVPDVYAVFDLGVFDTYTGSRHLAVSGASGAILRDEVRDDLAYGSPVAGDLDGDGRDEVLLLLMERQDSLFSPTTSVLLGVDVDGGETAKAWELATVTGFAATTPWLGDLDLDGRLDLVVAAAGFDEAGGLRTVVRVAIDADVPPSLPWAAYLGTSGDGHWRP